MDLVRADFFSLKRFSSQASASSFSLSRSGGKTKGSSRRHAARFCLYPSAGGPSSHQ